MKMKLDLQVVFSFLSGKSSFPDCGGGALAPFTVKALVKILEVHSYLT